MRHYGYLPRSVFGVIGLCSEDDELLATTPIKAPMVPIPAATPIVSGDAMKEPVTAVAAATRLTPDEMVQRGMRNRPDGAGPLGESG